MDREEIAIKLVSLAEELAGEVRTAAKLPGKWRKVSLSDLDKVVDSVPTSRPRDFSGKLSGALKAWPRNKIQLGGWVRVIYDGKTPIAAISGTLEDYDDWHENRVKKTYWLPEAGRTAARPRDETDDIIQDHVRALGNSVPDGHWGDVKDVLSVLVGNEADFNASNFVKALKKGDLSRFYVDTRVRLKPVQTGWSMGKVGKRDLVRAVKSLKEALSAGREASGSSAKGIARQLRRMACEVASE